MRETPAFVATFGKDHTLVCPLSTDLGQVRASLYNALTAPVLPGGTSVNDSVYWASSEELFQSQGAQCANYSFRHVGQYQLLHTASGCRTRLSSGDFDFPDNSACRCGSRLQRGRSAEDMAGATGGVSRTIYDPKDLSTALESIRADLENLYLVSYKSNLTERAAVKIRCTRKGTKVITPHKNLRSFGFTQPRSLTFAPVCPTIINSQVCRPRPQR